MNFRYIDYSQNMISTLHSKDAKNLLVVFSNYQLKNQYREKFGSNLFNDSIKIQTIEDFWNSLFFQERVLLKEAKRILTLYSTLSNEIKESLNISGYYSFIGLGNQFFKFYKDSAEYLKLDYEELQPWQEEKISSFKKMKEPYDRFLLENSFLPTDWVKHIDNFSLKEVENFKKILIVDVVEFSPLEREILKKISEIIPVEIVLQCNENDFDQENMVLKNVAFPEILKTDLKFLKVSSEIQEGIALIERLKREENRFNEIFSNDLENSALEKIFPKDFTLFRLDTLDNSDLYYFLKGIYDLVSSIEWNGSKVISLKVLEKNILLTGFRKNYCISDEDIEDFYKLLKDDFKYFSNNIYGENGYYLYAEKHITSVLTAIYEDVLNIQSFTTVSEFIDFILKDINIGEILESQYVDIVDKLMEVFELAKSSERIYGSTGLSYVFKGEESTGIFNLILKYMENLELKKNTPMVENRVIKPFTTSTNRQSSSIYFLDITSETLPGQITSGSFFTEWQKKNNGLLTADQEKLIKKYRFFQAVFSSEKSTIIFRENSSGVENKVSPLVDELLIHYSIEPEKNLISQGEALGIYKDSLYSESLYTSQILNSRKLPKTPEDFKDNRLNLGSYAYDNMVKCPFKFYFNDLKKLTPVLQEYERNITSRFIGIFLHDTLEEIAKKKYFKIITSGDFSLSKDEVMSILEKNYTQNLHKIPSHMKIYFTEVIFEAASLNIVNFYRELGEFFKGYKVTLFQGEKSSRDRTPFHGDPEVYLTGRVDLLIESEKGNYIIDYKTGGNSQNQLDFYAIMLYGNESAAEKTVFNIFSSFDFSQKNEKIYLTQEEMKINIENFMEKSAYNLTDKNSNCNYCPYPNICRKELKSEENRS